MITVTNDDQLEVMGGDVGRHSQEGDSSRGSDVNTRDDIDSTTRNEKFNQRRNRHPHMLTVTNR